MTKVMKKSHTCALPFHQKWDCAHFFKVMRITAFLFFLGIGSLLAGSSYSQSTKLSISLQRSSLRNVFEEIQRQSEFIIVYNDKQVDLKRKVNLHFENSTVDVILTEALKETGLSYQVFDRQIVIFASPDPAVRHQNTESLEQQGEKMRVSGKVTDTQGIPVPGVSIVVKGTTTGTISDVNGIFSFDAPAKSVLLFSFIGMKSQEIPAGNRTEIVVMEEETSALEEVMVVGYGTQKKASVVGAIQNINPSELQVSSRKNISNTLAGKLAGVIAVTRSGEPGYDQSSFWIRGISSFSGNTNPLVLVDGVQRTLDDLDIAEIESFSILKDAAASAMYGVRGANGVILVNTKRGKVQKPEVNFRVEHSITAPTKLPSFVNSADHMQLLNDLAAEEEKVPYYEQQTIDLTRKGFDPELYPDVDWIESISKNQSFNTRVNMNVNGGTDMLRYNLTGSVYSEDGIMKRDESLSYDTSTELTRYNLRSNVDLNITKTTSWYRNRSLTYGFHP